MIKPDQLRILVIVTAVLLVGAVWASLRQDGGSLHQLEGLPLLPGLSERISGLGRIELKGNDAQVTLVTEDGAWVVKSLDSYTADSFKVQSFVRGLVMARRLAAKSSNQDLFSRMGLAGEAITVELFSVSGDLIQSLDLGKRRQRPQEGESETFVFIEADGRVWTAKGLAEASTDPLDWIDRYVANIDGQRIREVSVTPADGAGFLLVRLESKTEKMNVITADGETRGADKTRAKRLMSGLAELQLENLLAAFEIPEEALEIAAVRYTTFDGLVIKLRVLEVEGTSYLRLVANYDETLIEAKAGEAVPAGGMPADHEAARFNSLWRNWAYKISSSRLLDMLVKLEILAAKPIPVPNTEDDE
jgi:hypothetical protein